MKYLLSFAVVLVAVVALAACGNPAPPAQTMATASEGDRVGRFVGLDGRKQLGPYTWVWRSKTFQPDQTAVTVAAYCPNGDVVLGGGVVAAPLWRDIANSRPTPNFDGWRVRFYKAAQGGTFTVTVYASCAPTQ